LFCASPARNEFRYSRRIPTVSRLRSLAPQLGLHPGNVLLCIGYILWRSLLLKQLQRLLVLLQRGGVLALEFMDVAQILETNSNPCSQP